MPRPPHINLCHRFLRSVMSFCKTQPFFLTLGLALLIAICFLTLPAFAGTLSEDLKSARSIMLDDVSNAPFGRGALFPLFQPAILASLFCIGLWTGLSGERVKTVWAIPVCFVVAIVIGAFISEFHPAWKPDATRFKEQYPDLPALLSTEGVSLIIAVVVGAIVAMNFTVPPLITLAIAVVLGLALGASDLQAITKDADHKSIIIPFWTGFGLTGLIMTIFGIGFETFAKSINMLFIIRIAGFLTAVAGLVLVVKTV